MLRKKIGIIGAGIGGLTAGALLSKKGFDVTIFEKESFIGGRAFTFENFSSLSAKDYVDVLSRFNMKVYKSEPDLDTIFDKHMLDGYKLDLGYHAIGGGVLSNVNTLLSEFGEHVDFMESFVGLVKKEGYDFPFLSRFDKLKILPNILRLLFASESTLRQLDSVSITETIKKYGKGKMTLILEIFSRSITTINNLDKISTGEMFRSQRNLYKGSKPCGYPIKGLSNIHDKLAIIIKKYGGEIKLNKPVKKIIIKDGKATGLIVDNEQINFDLIVSNTLVQDLFKLADESNFLPEYVKYIKSLKGTGSLCAYYSLSSCPDELIGKTFHFIERNISVDGKDAVGMIDFMTASKKAEVCPSDSHLVQSYIICTPDEARNNTTLEKLKGLMDKNLEILIPNYHSHLNWAIYPSIWHLDGVAKTIDNEKPEIKTPIENLYLLGDCVKAMGIGFNCALNSARKLNDILQF